jgi:hypothetical protein
VLAIGVVTVEAASVAVKVVAAVAAPRNSA